MLIVLAVLIVNKISTSMAAFASELSKICRLPKLGNKKFHAFLMDFCQKEAFNTGFYVFHWRGASVDEDSNNSLELF